MHQLGGEEADGEADLMEASVCREVAGVDGERDSRRSGRRRRSPSSGRPSLGATHQDEEEGEAETLDNTEMLDEASVVGKLRSSAAAEIS